jgi:hypothetical protein
VFVRGRAHPWEAGGSWVAQGWQTGCWPTPPTPIRSGSGTASGSCRWRTRTAWREGGRGSM